MISPLFYSLFGRFDARRPPCVTGKRSSLTETRRGHVATESDRAARFETQPTRAHQARAWAAKPTGVETPKSFDSAGLPKGRFFEPRRKRQRASANKRATPSRLRKSQPPKRLKSEAPLHSPARRGPRPSSHEPRRTQHTRGAAMAHDPRAGAARPPTPQTTPPTPKTRKAFKERIAYVQKKDR